MKVLSVRSLDHAIAVCVCGLAAIALGLSAAGAEISLSQLARDLKSGASSPALAAQTLAFAATHPPGAPLPAGELAALDDLLAARDPAVIAAAARVAGAWKAESASNRLGELAASETPEIQRAAFAALRQLGGAAALAQFSVLTRKGHPGELRRAALVAIAEISLDGAVMAAPEILRDLQTRDEALDLWRKLLAVPRAANSFAVRLPRGLPPPVLAAGAQAASELGEPGQALAKAIARAGGPPVR